MTISNINDKVFYRFVEFTSRLIKYNLAHEDYKQIALNKKEANTIIEKKVKWLADSFMYIINQTSQIIDVDIISTSYYLLSKKRLSMKNCERILRNVYLNHDETPYMKAASLIIDVYELNIHRKLEFVLLLANYILVKNGMYPIIFHEVDKSNLKHIIKMKSKKDLIDLIHMHEFQTRNGIGREHNGNPNITLDSVIKILKNNEKTLKSKLKVKHMFIYGGIVKKSTHTSSDVDLLVDFGQEMVSFHKHEYINKIETFLSSKIDSKLDILDFSYSLVYAEIKEMNNTIKIF